MLGYRIGVYLLVLVTCIVRLFGRPEDFGMLIMVLFGNAVVLVGLEIEAFAYAMDDDHRDRNGDDGHLSRGEVYASGGDRHRPAGA